MIKRRGILMINFSLLFLISSSLSDALKTQEWIGLAPFCHSTSDSCARLGFEYAASSRFDDSYIPCVTGRTVLCKISGHQAERSKERTPLNQLRVVALDLGVTPIDEEHYPSPYDGHMEKTCRIPKELSLQHKDADIIILQGAYVAGCTKQIPMYSLFDYYGWGQFSHIPAFMESSGLFIATRNPQAEVLKHFFKDESNENYPDGKYGFIVYQTKVRGETVMIINAHFYVKDAELRFEQMKEANQLLMGLLDSNMPTVFFGNYHLNSNDIQPLGTKGGYLASFTAGRKPRKETVTLGEFYSQDLIQFCPRLGNEEMLTVDFDMGLCKEESTTRSLIGENKLFKGVFEY